MKKALYLMLLTLSMAGLAMATGEENTYRPPNGDVTAPEIDGSTAIAALGFLSGGVMILRARRKK